MPVITLRRVVKHYATMPHNSPSAASQIAAAATRSIFNSAQNDYMDQARSHPEPNDRAHALDELSLTIKNGEMLSVVGPSGCGKTTLLKVIAGLIEPDAGDVLYDGVNIHDIPPVERGIGMVFQNYALYPHLTTHDNIGFFDLIHRHPERIPERIRHIVDVLGVDIKHVLSRKPPTLSGGEQQRVAVARCLARDPKIFLFDEPLSNLDAKLRTETRVQIKRLINYYRITTVYVTHDQMEAIALADRIAIMRAGKIEQIGTFQTLYETPRNAFVAQFFGSPSMNLFAGHVYRDTWESSAFSVSPVRPGLVFGQKVWLGIRPEHIKFADESADDAIPARITAIEPLFTERRKLVHLLLGGKNCLALTAFDAPLEANSPVHLRFPREYIYFFDDQTGARIG